MSFTKIILLLILVQVLCQENLISWYNFNYSAPNLPVHDIINNGDLSINKNHMDMDRKDIWSTRLHLGRGDYLESKTVSHIKRKVLESGELTIQVIADMSKLKDENLCLFCLMDKTKESLNELVRKCSKFDVGIIKIQGFLQIVFKETHATHCNTMRRFIIWKKEYETQKYQNIVLIQDKESRRIFINGKKVLEINRPPISYSNRYTSNYLHSTEQMDISNWNEKSELYIGGDKKEKIINKDSYIDVYDIAIWNKALNQKEFEKIHSQPLNKYPGNNRHRFQKWLTPKKRNILHWTDYHEEKEEDCKDDYKEKCKKYKSGSSNYNKCKKDCDDDCNKKKKDKECKDKYKDKCEKYKDNIPKYEKCKKKYQSECTSTCCCKDEDDYHINSEEQSKCYCGNEPLPIIYGFNNQTLNFTGKCNCDQEPVSYGYDPHGSGSGSNFHSPYGSGSQGSHGSGSKSCGSDECPPSICPMKNANGVCRCKRDKPRCIYDRCGICNGDGTRCEKVYPCDKEKTIKCVVQHVSCSIIPPTETEFNNSHPIISVDKILDEKYLLIANASFISNQSDAEAILKCHQNTPMWLSNKLRNGWNSTIDTATFYCPQNHTNITQQEIKFNILSQYVTVRELFECVTGMSSSVITKYNIDEKINLIEGTLKIISKDLVSHDPLYYYPCNFALKSKITKIKEKCDKHKKVIISSFDSNCLDVKIKNIFPFYKSGKLHLKFETCFNVLHGHENEQFLHDPIIKVFGGQEMEIVQMTSCDPEGPHSKCCQKWTLETTGTIFYQNLISYKSDIFIKVLENYSGLSSKFKIFIDLFNIGGLFKKQINLELNVFKKVKSGGIEIDGGAFKDKNLTIPLKEFYIRRRHYFLLTAHKGKCCKQKVVLRQNPIYKWGDCPMKNSTKELKLKKVFLNIPIYDRDRMKVVLQKILLLDVSHGSNFYGCPPGSPYKKCSHVEYHSNCKTQIRFSFLLKAYQVDGATGPVWLSFITSTKKLHTPALSNYMSSIENYMVSMENYRKDDGSWETSSSSYSLCCRGYTDSSFTYYYIFGAVFVIVLILIILLLRHTYKKAKKAHDVKIYYKNNNNSYNEMNYSESDNSYSDEHSENYSGDENEYVQINNEDNDNYSQENKLQMEQYFENKIREAFK